MLSVTWCVFDGSDFFVSLFCLSGHASSDNLDPLKRTQQHWLCSSWRTLSERCFFSLFCWCYFSRFIGVSLFYRTTMDSMIPPRWRKWKRFTERWVCLKCMRSMKSPATRISCHSLTAPAVHCHQPSLPPSHKRSTNEKAEGVQPSAFCFVLRCFSQSRWHLCEWLKVCCKET